MNLGLNLLQSGGTIEQLEATILGSAEYFQRIGETNSLYVSALYQDVLGRPTGPGSQFFLSELTDGFPRSQVAMQILLSTQRLTDAIGFFYLAVLGRPADAAGAFFVTAIQRGALRDEDVIAQILGSDEFLGQL